MDCAKLSLKPDLVHIHPPTHPPIYHKFFEKLVCFCILSIIKHFMLEKSNQNQVSVVQYSILLLFYNFIKIQFFSVYLPAQSIFLTFYKFLPHCLSQACFFEIISSFLWNVRNLTSIYAQSNIVDVESHPKKGHKVFQSNFRLPIQDLL